jgi:hypothetical protein
VQNTIIGKVAAVVPIDVPTTAIVMGCTAVKNIMNGIGRIKLMIKFKI